MCMMAIGIVASLAGTAISAMGAIQQGQAAKSAAKYEEQVAGNNAIIASRMASDAKQRGEVEVEDHRRKVSALHGRQVSVMSAGNVDITSGSPLDILGDTAQLGELDALTIRGNAEREALGHQSTAMNYKAQGGMARMKGDAAAKAGTIGALGSLASGIGSVAGAWYKK